MAKRSEAFKARRKAKTALAQAETRAICAALRANGACCNSCQHKGYRVTAEMVCELNSDFYGYVRVKPDHVCRRFESAKPTPTKGL